MARDMSGETALSTLGAAAFAEKVENLRGLASAATSEEEAREVISRIAQISRAYRIQHGIGLPNTPIEQAIEVDPMYRPRPHLEYISDRLVQAVRDVERGQNRMLAVSMPPRAGKSTLISLHSPLWFLRRHPEWKIISTSYDGGLSGGWTREIRRIIETRPDLGIALKSDGGAGARWSTVEGGGMYATATNGSLTGRGARVFIIDDPIKDFVEAHSLKRRENQWNWWLSVAQTRLEPPYLVLVVMTRWHEDDFVGRLLNPEMEGDPEEWEKIRLPALAETDDQLGRDEGEPLISPLLDETPSMAIERWDRTRGQVGSYTFASMYQQRPAPQKGAIFDTSWWRFWTWNPENATEDGRVIYLDPSTLEYGRWLDSWDTSFKGGGDSDWVVGQRWVREKADRFLVWQKRGRWSFTQTLDQMEAMSAPTSRYGEHVHERLIEEAANGAAIIDVMKSNISGLKPVRPRTSKESRARAVTPEVESGNVYLPHPGDPGNEWVSDLLSELRNFPHDVHDDQVDALTQALGALRDNGRGQISVPGRLRAPHERGGESLVRAARSDYTRRRGVTTGINPQVRRRM